jgi:hypothetical protein
LEWIEVRLGRFEQLYFSGRLGNTLDELFRELSLRIEQWGTAEQRCKYYFMATSHAFLRARYAFDQGALEPASMGLRAVASMDGEPVATARLLMAGALMCGSVEQRRQAVEHLELAASAATGINDATLLARIRIYHAIVLLRLGEIAATESAARLAFEAAEAAQLVPYLAAAEGCLGWVAWRRGAVEEARATLESARLRFRATPHKFPFRHFVLLPLIDQARHRDDFEDATSLLRELSESGHALPPAVESALLQALDALAGDAPREASMALEEVVLAAQEAALI